MARRSDHSREELKRLALDAAKEIVAQGGLQSLRARAVADRIGYTVGTLYQVFHNLDDLTERMNTETLTELFEYCQDARSDAPAQERLNALADRFIAFANTNQNRWNAIINHQLPADYERSEAYSRAVTRLLGLVEQVIAPLYPEGRESERLHDARVLWAGLYGIYALAATNRLSKHETVAAMVGTLIEIFVSARSPN
ncbi:MAG: TetR/AcrR family transcriptional regulator [Paracoccaceae bacterium]